MSTFKEKSFLPDFIAKTSKIRSSDCLKLRDCQSEKLLETIVYSEYLYSLAIVNDAAITEQPPNLIESPIRSKSERNKWQCQKVSTEVHSNGNEQCLEGCITNLTKCKAAERALRESEARFRRLVEATFEGIFVHDMGTILDVNQALATMSGYECSELIGMNAFNLLAVESRDVVLKNILSDYEKPYEAVALRKDGSTFSVEIQGKALIYQGRKIRVVAVRDITERKRTEAALRQAEQKYRSIFENAVEGIFQTTVDGRYLMANPMLARILGYDSPEELIVTITDIEHQLYVEPNSRAEFMSQVQANGSVCEFEAQVYCKDGRAIWISENAHAIYDSSGQLIGYEGTVEDISKRKQAEATIRYQAFHDLMTDLPNRMLFNEQLSQALINARCRQKMLAVMFLDLDRFKTINDTLGHAVGDRLLQGVAKRVTDCLREGDIVARWGGDEFTVLLPHISCASDVAKIAQRILDSLKPAFNIEGHELYIRTSIGIALYPLAGEDAEPLLRNADAALYRAKQQGRNNYQFYTAAMNSQAGELFQLENELHQALKREEFVIYYQPQVNTTTGEITGMEALVRWQHPKFGLISPAKFIPIAEETGLIVALDEWVLWNACAQNKAWQDAGFEKLRVAVNLSARQFQQPDIVEMVARTLYQTGLSPQYLELEVTETIAMQNLDKSQEILSNLHQMGIHLSLDDFGTGYSSLTYLKQFPLHTLKIDKSFVKDITTDPQQAGIINAIMILGKAFNLRVVAEGVETEAQKNCLRSFQCEEMQGYLFSKPVSAESATQLLQDSLLKKTPQTFGVVGYSAN